MINIAGDELLQHEERLLITQRLQSWPQLVSVVDRFNPHRTGLGTRLEQPWRGDAGHELTQIVVVENTGKFRNQQASIAGCRPHRQLVAEVASQGVAHPRHAEVLPQVSSSLYIEIIESDDQVNMAAARQVRDGVDDVGPLA